MPDLAANFLNAYTSENSLADVTTLSNAIAELLSGRESEYRAELEKLRARVVEMEAHALTDYARLDIIADGECPCQDESDYKKCCKPECRVAEAKSARRECYEAVSSYFHHESKYPAPRIAAEPTQQPAEGRCKCALNGELPICNQPPKIGYLEGAEVCYNITSMGTACAHDRDCHRRGND